MHDDGGIGSGNSLLRAFGVVGCRMIEMEGDTWKRLSPLVVAEIPFDVRQNQCAKELRILSHPDKQNKKIIRAGHRPNNGNQNFWPELSLLFESEEWSSIEPNPDHGSTSHQTMTRHQ
jgi:hypothetical protein